MRSEFVVKLVPRLGRAVQTQGDRVADLFQKHVGRSGTEGRHAVAVVVDLNPGEFGNAQGPQRFGGRWRQDFVFDFGKVDRGKFGNEALHLNAGSLAQFAIVGIIFDDGNVAVVGIVVVTFPVHDG